MKTFLAVFGLSLNSLIFRIVASPSNALASLRPDPRIAMTLKTNSFELSYLVSSVVIS